GAVRTVDSGQIGAMGGGEPIGVAGLAGEEHAIGYVAGDQRITGLGASRPGDRIAATDVGVASPGRDERADDVAPDVAAEGPYELGDGEVGKAAPAAFRGQEPVQRAAGQMADGERPPEGMDLEIE